MDLKKNDLVEVRITDMDENGSGIGKLEGFPLFIHNAVIGDLAKVVVTKVKKTYGFGKMLELISPSSFRVEARCPVSVPCGGCQLQELSYEAQLDFKQKRVRDCLERIGGFSGIAVEKVIPSEKTFAYRNKAQYPVGTDAAGRPAVGFYAGRSHRLIPCDSCELVPSVFQRICLAVTGWMEQQHISPYDENTHKGIVRHIFLRRSHKTGKIMVCLVINAAKCPADHALVAALTKIKEVSGIGFSPNREPGNVIMGKKYIALWGDAFLTDTIGQVQYRISPLSFYQVNPEQTEKLYERALQFAGLSGSENVFDLYCGIGTISLFLAQKAKKVVGIEIVPQAIEDAKYNAALNGIENAQFYAGAAEEIILQLQKEHGISPDVIVVDPPRKGCERSLLQAMAEYAPKKIVYVSCNPATLARDAKILCENGYEITKVQPVDMFPMTVHVECVALLSKAAK